MTDQFPALIAFSLSMCFTPGPNVVMVVASAATFGFKKIIPQMAGITLGFFALILVAGLGLSVVADAGPSVHTFVKVVGTLYLLVLAWRIATAGKIDKGGVGKPIGFWEAAALQVFNPKGWASSIGALAAYTVSTQALLPQVLLIALILSIACLLSVMTWGAFGNALSAAISGRYARAFNLAMAGVLVLSLFPTLQ